MRLSGWENDFGWLGHGNGQRHPVCMLTVFQAGEERVLLETRRRVLESIGVTVVTAAGAREALEQIPGLQFDLAILCHSLPSNSRKGVAAALRSTNPAAPILLVGRGAAGMAACEATDMDAIVDPHPERLTETLRRLLHLKQRTTASRGERMREGAD